jgi:hypothetical protein
MPAGWSKSDLSDYEKAQRERLRVYSKADDVLYNMCKKWPNHGDYGATQAKVRVIGRVYAAGLERKGKKDKSKGIYETVAELLYRNRTWIDREFRILRRFKRLSKPACLKILEVHGRIVELLRKETKSKLNFRSFVSKYLHFHIPIVPIFDSQSLGTINNPDWYSWKEYKGHIAISMGKKYDPVYYRFVMQFLLYFSDLEEVTQNPSVKEADWYLIWSYE